MTNCKLTSIRRAAKFFVVFFGLALSGCSGVGAPLDERVQQLEIRPTHGAYNPCAADQNATTNLALEFHSQCFAMDMPVADVPFAGNEV